MEHNLSYEKLMEYRTAFESFIKSKDGQISTKNLGNILRNLGQNPNEKDLNEMILEVDADGSGTIDFGEFIGLIIRKMKDSDMDEEIREAFEVFDKDGNKVITAHELRAVLSGIKGIPEDEIEEMILEADSDNDGQIDLDEFIKLMGAYY
jgi:calmodulin